MNGSIEDSFMRSDSEYTEDISDSLSDLKPLNQAVSHPIRTSNNNIVHVTPKYGGKIEVPTDSSSDTQDSLSDLRQGVSDLALDCLEMLTSPRQVQTSPDKIRSPSSRRKSTPTKTKVTKGKADLSPTTATTTNSTNLNSNNNNNNNNNNKKRLQSLSVLEGHDYVKVPFTERPSRADPNGVGVVGGSSKLDHVTKAWTDFRSILVLEFSALENELKQKTRGLKGENDKLAVTLQSKKWEFEILHDENMKLNEMIAAHNQMVQKLRNENKTLQDLLAVEMKNMSTKYNK